MSQEFLDKTKQERDKEFPRLQRSKVSDRSISSQWGSLIELVKYLNSQST